MYIQKLTIDDLPLIDKLIDDRPQRIGFSNTKVSREDYIDMTAKMLTLPAHITYGCYSSEDNSLISYMTFFDFPNLPYYCATNFKVLEKFNYYDQVKNGFIKLLDVCELKEQEGRYSMFLGRAVYRNVDNRKKIIKQFTLEAPVFWQKYIRTIEEYIPAGQPSKYDYFNKAILRGKVFDNDFIIMRMTCKQQYRTILPPELQETSLKYLENLID
jgi:hypothetical protein